MERITSLILEDARGQWPVTVNWIAALRPVRFDHDNRTFDAARRLADGTWVYRTSQPRVDPIPVPVRLEAGIARTFVTEFVVPPPVPDAIEYQDATYRRKGVSDGRHLYWHG
jgi:hypothetical protein